MGTRHLTCVWQDDAWKVAQYGQWDGYPEGAGMEVLLFLRGADLEAFAASCRNVRWVGSSEAAALWNSGKPHPELSRDTGPKILSVVLAHPGTHPLGLWNDIAFAADSIFCEWAYVIDLDANTFEVYKGFNNEPLPEDARFYCAGAYEEIEGGKRYYPVRLVKAYPLDTLPSGTRFVHDMRAKDDE